MNNFLGDPILLEKYNYVVNDLKTAYNNGISFCFAGTAGVGKTMTATNIIKRAVEKNYSAMYVTLSDIVNCMINASPADRVLARKELLQVDFLIIDEFDPRFMGSELAADLYGRILEDIFRYRAQNKAPTFMCTNSPKVVDSFTGAIKASISSLLNYTQMVSVIGKDMRKEGK